MESHIYLNYTYIISTYVRAVHPLATIDSNNTSNKLFAENNGTNKKCKPAKQNINDCDKPEVNIIISKTITMNKKETLFLWDLQ